MTLWHRAPREVYRVYGEDEYLAENDVHANEESSRADEGSQLSSATNDPSRVLDGAASEDVRTVPAYRDEGHPTVVSSRSPGSRSGRLVGLGLLIGVTVGAFALVVLNASHRPPIAPGSGVAQSARAGAASHTSAANHASDASHTSAGVPTNPEPAIHMATVPLSHARVSVRPSVRLLAHPRSRTDSPTESAPNASSIEPWQSRPSTPELPESDAAATPIDGEFDFER